MIVDEFWATPNAMIVRPLKVIVEVVRILRDRMKEPPVSGIQAWAETLQLLAGERIHDVVVAALVDRSDPGGRAEPLFSEVFLELDTGFLSLSSVNNHGGLLVRHAPEIDTSELREVWLGSEVILIELGYMFLHESRPMLCTRIEYITNEESDLDRGIVNCVEIHLANDRQIFVDSFHGLGNPGTWTRSYEEYASFSFERHVWSPPTEENGS